MSTTRVEVRQGYYVEVKSRGRQKPTGKNLEAELVRMIGFRPREMRKRYTMDQLDKAAALSDEIGIDNAARKTGVNKWSIRERRRQLRRQMGIEGCVRRHAGKRRYTEEQKRECVRIAQQLMNSGETKKKLDFHGVYKVIPKWGRVDAFKEAGRRLGMNGFSIYHMFVQGMI